MVQSINLARAIIRLGLVKAPRRGPYIGPKGGKWADAAHTHPWKQGDLFDQRSGGERSEHAESEKPTSGSELAAKLYDGTRVAGRIGPDGKVGPRKFRHQEQAELAAVGLGGKAYSFNHEWYVALDAHARPEVVPPAAPVDHSALADRLARAGKWLYPSLMRMEAKEPGSAKGEVLRRLSPSLEAFRGDRDALATDIIARMKGYAEPVPPPVDEALVDGVVADIVKDPSLHATFVDPGFVGDAAQFVSARAERDGKKSDVLATTKQVLERLRAIPVQEPVSVEPVPPEPVAVKPIHEPVELVASILTKPGLDPNDYAQVQGLARNLVDKVKTFIGGLFGWRDKEATKAMVQVKIHDELWDGLPDSYHPAELDSLSKKVFEAALHGDLDEKDEASDDGQLSADEQRQRELAALASAAARRGKLKPHEQVIYDHLEGDDDERAELAEEIGGIVEDDMRSPDWQMEHRAIVQAHMRSEIKRLLRRHEYVPQRIPVIADAIVHQLRNMAPAVEAEPLSLPVAPVVAPSSENQSAQVIRDVLARAWAGSAEDLHQLAIRVEQMIAQGGDQGAVRGRIAQLLVRDGGFGADVARSHAAQIVAGVASKTASVAVPREPESVATTVAVEPPAMVEPTPTELPEPVTSVTAEPSVVEPVVDVPTRLVPTLFDPDGRRQYAQSEDGTWYARERFRNTGPYEEWFRLSGEPERSELQDSDPELPSTVLSPEDIVRGRARVAANKEAVARAKELLKSRSTPSPEDIAVISRYTGDGGVGSSLNQFFTRPDLASAIWDFVKRLWGPSGGVERKALEPACGAGVFLAVAPPNVSMTGVEIDGDAAAVAQVLHLDHEVRHQSFEAYCVANTGKEPVFDAVVGNAPFRVRTGNVSRLHKPEQTDADRYFIDTSLDNVKDGGVVAMIVYRSLMESKDDSAVAFRRSMLAKAELVDAYRLSNDAFKHSGTEAVADVLFLRKRPAADRAVLQALDDAGRLTSTAEAMGDEECRSVIDGRFFAVHPDRIFGKALTAEEAGYRATVVGNADDIPRLISERSAAPVRVGVKLNRAAIEDYRERAGDAEKIALDEALTTALPKDRPPVVGDVREFGIGPARGRYVYLDGEWQPISNAQTVATIIERTSDPATREAYTLAQDIEEMLRARNGYTRPAASIDGEPSGEPTWVPPDYYRARGLRRELETRLKRWIAEHGIPGEHKGLVKLAESTPVLVNLLAAVGSDGELTDAMKQDAAIIATASVSSLDNSSLSDVVKYVAGRFGDVDIDAVAQLWSGGSGLDYAAIRNKLISMPDVMVENDGTLRHREDYLSGKVYDKLDAARARLASPDGGLSAADTERNEQKLAEQISALEAVIKDRRRAIESVDLSLDQRWIPLDIISAFFSSKEGRAAWDSITTNAWAERMGSSFKGIRIIEEDHVRHVALMMADGREGVLPTDLRAHPLMKYLNGLGVGRERMPQIARINATFNDWVRSGEHADTIGELYNRTFFSEIAQRYSGDPLEINGMNPAMTPHPHQNEWTRWAIDTGCGIIAGGVGTGKTFVGAMIAKKLRDDGKARRVMLPIPKSVATNWEEELQVLFPGSRVLVVGEHWVEVKDKKTGQMVKRKVTDSPAERDLKLALIRQNEYDFILCTRPAFHAIPITPESQHRLENDPDKWTSYHNVRANELAAARGKKSGTAQEKAAERAKAKFEAEKATRELRVKRGVIFWEDLGIDCIIADEAHAYKNLEAAKQRFGQKPKYLGGAATSKSSQDMLYKAELVRELAERNRPGEKGRVYLMTGTPAKNSPLELYNLLCIVAPEEMQIRGIKNAENFIDRYCQIELKPALSVSGGKKVKATGKRKQSDGDADDTPDVPKDKSADDMVSEVLAKIKSPKGLDDVDEQVEVEAASLADFDGDIVEAPCVTGFKNLSELKDLLDKYVLARSAEDIGLTLPKETTEEVIVPMLPIQLSIYRELQQSMSSLPSLNDDGEVEVGDGEKDPSEILRALTDMQQVSQDLYIYGQTQAKRDKAEGLEVGETYTREDGMKSPKYVEAVNRIIEGTRERGGQIVFAEQLLVHEMLRDMLIAGGMKPEEIGIINAKLAPDSGTRQDIADRFNRGELKVVIGNTGTMGEGVNLQGKKNPKGTTDMHHIDQPWDPGSLTQRKGRMVRQGNPAKEAKHHVYLSQDSFDGYRFATLQGKQRWLDKLRSGVDTLENEADMTSQLKEIAEIARFSSNSADAQAFKERREKMLVAQWNAKQRVKEMDRFHALQRDKHIMNMASDPARKAQMAARVAATIESLRRSEMLPPKAMEALDDPEPVAIGPDGGVLRVGKVYNFDGGSQYIKSVDPTQKRVVTLDLGHPDGADLDFTRSWDSIPSADKIEPSPMTLQDELLYSAGSLNIDQFYTPHIYGRGSKNRPSRPKGALKRMFSNASPEAAQAVLRRLIFQKIAARAGKLRHTWERGDAWSDFEVPVMLDGKPQAVNVLRVLSPEDRLEVLRAARDVYAAEANAQSSDMSAYAKEKQRIADKYSGYMERADEMWPTVDAQIMLPWHPELTRKQFDPSHKEPLYNAKYDTYDRH